MKTLFKVWNGTGECANQVGTLPFLDLFEMATVGEILHHDWEMLVTGLTHKVSLPSWTWPKFKVQNSYPADSISNPSQLGTQVCHLIEQKMNTTLNINCIHYTCDTCDLNWIKGDGNWVLIHQWSLKPKPNTTEIGCSLNWLELTVKLILLHVTINGPKSRVLDVINVLVHPLWVREIWHNATTWGDNFPCFSNLNCAIVFCPAFF